MLEIFTQKPYSREDYCSLYYEQKYNAARAQCDEETNITYRPYSDKEWIFHNNYNPIQACL